MYVCVCNAVTDRQIRAAVADGAQSIEDLRDRLKVSTCCGRCSDCAKRIIRQSQADCAVTSEPLMTAFAV